MKITKTKRIIIKEDDGWKHFFLQFEETSIIIILRKRKRSRKNILKIKKYLVPSFFLFFVGEFNSLELNYFLQITFYLFNFFFYLLIRITNI